MSWMFGEERVVGLCCLGKGVGFGVWACRFFARDFFYVLVVLVYGGGRGWDFLEGGGDWG